MFTIRNVGGVALFLFGTTFVWLTPMFAAAAVDTSGAAWSTTAVLAAVTIIGFTIATWGCSDEPTGGSRLRSLQPWPDWSRWSRTGSQHRARGSRTLSSTWSFTPQAAWEFSFFCASRGSSTGLMGTS
jgi:hypothetical protein